MFTSFIFVICFGIIFMFLIDLKLLTSDRGFMGVQVVMYSFLFCFRKSEYYLDIENVNLL